jgi:hypothetical protein
MESGLDIKDCPLARDNQIWLPGKQIFMSTCPTDIQIFHIFVDIYYIGQVKISFGQPVLTLHFPDGLVQKNVEPWEWVGDVCFALLYIIPSKYKHANFHLLAWELQVCILMGPCVYPEARSVSLVYLVTNLILVSINRFHQSQYNKTPQIWLRCNLKCVPTCRMNNKCFFVVRLYTLGKKIFRTTNYYLILAR